MEDYEEAELTNLQSQYQNITGYGASDNLPRWQLSMQEELEDFYRRLLAIRKNPQYDGESNKHRFIRFQGAERVNEVGANAIMSVLADRLTKITSDTKIDEELIKKESFESDSSFSVWLAGKSRDFEIKTAEDYNMICESFIHLCKLALYRSIKGWKGDLINMHPTTREVVYRENEEKSKKQGLSLPFNYGGGK